MDRVTVTSLTGAGNDASAAVFNGQTNAGAITSTVAGANVGIFSFSGEIQSASVGVSGNSIGATSVGNFTTSSVIRASR
ncbi:MULTISPECIES: hypothetical protein [Marivita]|jgi:hypothetical protein|uniref:Uncharacterized protein n=1 Tax=Marivita cryptomonadis TaxID=505252 RepID=A0A9Q2S7G3_9RHOB|nr:MULTISPECIES: hypothetical protein [Marivita]MBM2324179.1 hypothetical protein [Marivita cryptomonadis]MBM2333769.1 hypothetical protein [Marivita cryptomonadis]MBM2343346.1 hypothetical protein [Marivita cryptomonadis]MBM2348018.1 hypothetical protein [Marivita cryptomonadis]MBM2352699.1 hypothetical protein [Marivita cryptomonadis]